MPSVMDFLTTLIQSLSVFFPQLLCSIVSLWDRSSQSLKTPSHYNLYIKNTIQSIAYKLAYMYVM